MTSVPDPLPIDTQVARVLSVQAVAAREMSEEEMGPSAQELASLFLTTLHASRNPAPPAQAYLRALERALQGFDWPEPVLPSSYKRLWASHPSLLCARCDREIMQDPGGRWTHLGSEGKFVGCRAASYRPDSGWDDDLPRHWNAMPAQE